MNINENFKKNGLIHIKNFFTEDEINKIDKRAKEILNDKFEFIYIVNIKKVEGSFLSNKKFETLRNQIISLCAEQDLKIKSLENFIEIFEPLLRKFNPQQYYLEKLHALFIENHQSNADMLFDETYSSIFLTHKVLDVYRELLQSNNLIYCGESHVDYNKPPIMGLNKNTSRGWHPDDWFNHHENTSEPTYMVRGALFYHSAPENSGGTKFLPGSHYYIRPVKLIKKILKKIIYRKNFNNSIMNTRFLFPRNIFPSKRDFILWDKRLLHSAWAVKIKGFSKVVLPPLIEDILCGNDIYKVFIEENSFPRSLANLDFGRKSKSLDKYMEAYGNRPDYKNYWKDKSKLLSDDFKSKLYSKNIEFSDKAITTAEKND